MNYFTYKKRLDYLFDLIKNGRLDSPKQLVEQFECSEKTIRNMINALRDNGAEICYCKASKKYILKDNSIDKESSDLKCSDPGFDEIFLN